MSGTRRRRSRAAPPPAPHAAAAGLCATIWTRTTAPARSAPVYTPVKGMAARMDYTDTKAKCRHIKKFTWKGSLRQVFIRVYRLVIQLVMMVFLA